MLLSQRHLSDCLAADVRSAPVDAKQLPAAHVVRQPTGKILPEFTHAKYMADIASGDEREDFDVTDLNAAPTHLCAGTNGYTVFFAVLPWRHAELFRKRADECGAAAEADGMGQIFHGLVGPAEP